MADILITLMQSAIYKKAAAMEQWLIKHSDHYPRPAVEYQTDKYTSSIGRCSCGESVEVALLINTIVTVTKKR